MPLQGKQFQGVTKARVGSTWRTLATVDFSAASSDDWTGNGDFTVDGVTHTVTGGGKCSTFGPDGSTGVKWVQGTSGIYSTGGSPTVSVDLADFSSIADGGEIMVDVHYTADNTPGNNARLVGALYASNTRHVACGPRYQSSPGQWEYGAFTASNKFTDYGIALADSTNAVMTFIYTTKGMRWWDRGSWSGSFPALPAASAMDDAAGVDISSGESVTIPKLTTAKFQLATIRTSGSTQFTVHRYRIRYRSIR